MTRVVRFGGTSNVPLLADLYVPEGDGPHPLVIGVSGGGWIKGTRGDLAAWGGLLATQGFVFASVDYRRATDGPAFPGNAEDIALALTHFSQSDEVRGIDKGRIAVLGVSAGAHLGAVATFNDAFRAPRPRAFAGIYGVYDLVAHWEAEQSLDANPDRTARMMGCSAHDEPQLYHDASPLRHISRDGVIPVYLAWGSRDREVSPRQSLDFAGALRVAGYSVDETDVEDAGHFWFSREDPTEAGTHSARVAPSLLRFLQRALAVS